VIIAVILLVLGLIAGLARGGKLENVANLKFHYPILVFLGLGIQVTSEIYAAYALPELRNDGRGMVILVSSFVLLIAFVALNARMPGMLIVGFGLFLNILVIVLNDGMPVSLEAARVLGIDFSDYLDSAIKHRELDSGTVLAFLGDIIPIPVIDNIVSIGDVVLGVGVFVLVERAVEYKPRRRRGRFGSGAPAEDKQR
jgi:hypothetical protein